MAGTLVKRDLGMGAMVDRDDQPLAVMNLDTVWVIANVFERDISALGLGDSARITADAYSDRSFEGVVRYIGDTVDRSTRTVQARVEVVKQEVIATDALEEQPQLAGCVLHRGPILAQTDGLQNAGSRFFGVRFSPGGSIAPVIARSFRVGPPGKPLLSLQHGVEKALSLSKWFCTSEKRTARRAGPRGVAPHRLESQSLRGGR